MWCLPAGRENCRRVLNVTFGYKGVDRACIPPSRCKSRISHGGGAGCIGSFTRKSMFFMFYSYRVLPFPAKNASVCMFYSVFSREFYYGYRGRRVQTLTLSSPLPLCTFLVPFVTLRFSLEKVPNRVKPTSRCGDRDACFDRASKTPSVRHGAWG